MSVQQVVAPGNLGAEFDVGAEEANRIHVRAGRGLWRDGDRLESIPWGPEERWILFGMGATAFGANFLVDGAAAWDGSNPSLAEIANVSTGGVMVLKNVGGSGVDWTFGSEPGSTWAGFDGSNGEIGFGAGFGMWMALYGAPGVGWQVTFAQPAVVSLTFFLEQGVGILSGAGAAWTSSEGNDGGQGTDVLTFDMDASPQEHTVNSVNAISGFTFHIENGYSQVALQGAVITPVEETLYTVQRYTDGRILAVADGDQGDIRESLTGMSLLDKGPLNNFTATTGPTVADDVSKGYGRGSRWNNGVDEWVCMDGTPGAAEWRLAT